MTPEEQKVLASVGRAGWTILSRLPATETVAGSYPGEKVLKYPEGSVTWVISDGKGHNQPMVVQPPAAYPGPYSPTTNDPGPYNAAPTVVEPPKDLAAAADGGKTEPSSIETVNGRKVQVYTNRPLDGSQGPKMDDLGPADTKAVDTASIETIGGHKVLVHTGRPADGSQGPRMEDLGPAQSAAADALATAQAGLTQANAELAKATQPADIAAAQLKVDQAQQALDQAKALAPGAVAQQGATTALTTAQAAVAQANAELARATQPDEIAAAKLKVSTAQQALDAAKAQAPATLAGTEATTAGTQANTAAVQQQTAQRNAPTVVGSPAATDRVITTRDPNTGALTTQPNPNTTDVAAQVQQINQAAHTFRDNLQTQVLNGQLDPDEALQKFHDYWNTTVEPQRQALVDAQQKAQFNQGLQARQQASTEEQNRAASNLSTQQTGEAAGNDAVKRAMDLLPLQVGPQYGQHMAEAINGLATGHPTSNFTSADFTSTAPDMNAIHHQAVAEALKGISPYAASQIGAPMPSIPQGVDINGLLNQSQYGGSFSAAPSAPAASSATTTIGPDGTVTVQHVPPYAQSGQPSGATPITQATQPIPAYMPRAGNLDSVPSPTY